MMRRSCTASISVTVISNGPVLMTTTLPRDASTKTTDGAVI